MEIAVPTVKKGSKGANAKLLQKNLNRFGCGLVEDGIFGKASAAALKAWQKAYGLSADGIYGAKSAAKMRELLWTIHFGSPIWKGHWLMPVPFFFREKIEKLFKKGLTISIYWYIIKSSRKERRWEPMKKRRKKNGNHDDLLLKLIIIVTAIVNLIVSIIELVNKLLE